MSSRLFYNPQNRPIGISRLTKFLALGFLFSAPAALAGAPDWLRTAAREPVPSYPNDPVAVILYDEQITTVKNTGEIETLYRRAYKILRPEGRMYGTVVVSFDSETRLTYLKAWSIPADGKEYEVKEKDAVETSLLNESFYEDTRHKILTIPAADPGNVVGYEYVQKRRPFVLQDGWWFQHVIPVRRSHFSLQLPGGWEFTSFWRNYADSKPREAGKSQWVWELENIPPIEEEPEMPPWRAVAGRLVVNYFPQDAKTQNSWQDIGLWYAGLTSDSRHATPEIQQKVVALTSSNPALLDKIRALTTFLQREIRYVAIEIGIGGYQPHFANEVFQHRYGDCKDKATLLSAMLREIGIESYYVLVHTDRGVVLPEFPSALSFNHAILAIRLPQGVPTEILYALLDHPKLGRLLFFDPTDQYTPLGYLPSTLQDNYGLVVTADGAELLRLPLLPPATNRLLRSAQLKLSLAGTLSGEVQEVRWGAPAVNERERFLRANDAERGKILESFLGNSLGGFVLNGVWVGNLEKYDESLTLKYRFVAEHYAKPAGDLLVLRPRVLGEKSSDLLERKPRKYPVEFPEATLQTDFFEITLPPGYVVDEIPPPVKVDYGFGGYRSEVEAAGNTLRYKRTYEIKNVIVSIQGLEELKRFFRQISADEHSSVVLRRATP